MNTTVTEAHKTEVVRILANLSGGVTVKKPDTTKFKRVLLSKAEICERANLRPRVIRQALSQLCEEGLVSKSQQMVNSPGGIARCDRYGLNWDRTEDILPYIEFSPPPKRPVRVG